MGTNAGDGAILDVLEEIVVQYDDAGTVVRASLSLFSTLGVEPALITGTTFRIPLAGGGAFPTEFGPVSHRPLLATAADKRPVWLDAAITPLPSGDFLLTARTLDDDAGSADILQRMDAQNRTVWMTSSVEALTGWTVEECLGDTHFEWIHPADTERVAQAMIALRAGQQDSFDLKARMLLRSGTYLWWSIHAECDADSGDVILAYRDVDNEVRLEAELERQEHLRAAVLDNLLDPFAIVSPVWDSNGQLVDLLYVDANPAAQRVLGDPPDLLGKAVSEVLPPQTAVELFELCQEAQRSAAPVTLFDHPLISSWTTRVTRRYDVRVWGVEDRFGVTWRDVTERPTVAGRDGVGADVVLRISDDGTIEWVSASVVTILGWEGSDLVGTPWLDLIHPEDRVQLPDQSGRVRVRLARNDGDWRWTEASVRPVKAGQSAGHLAELRDVDEEMQAQHAKDVERSWLRAAFDAALDPFVLLTAVRDPDGSIVDFAYAEVNEAACVYNGMSREALLGSSLLTLMPQHAQDLLDRYATVVTTGDPLILDDFAFEFSDHVPPRRLEVRATKIEDGLALTWRDVTDRAAAAEHVASSEARLSLMLDTMAEGVMVYNLRGDLVEANRAARDILGMDTAHMTRERREAGRYQLLAPDGTPLTADQHPVVRAMTAGESIRAEVFGLQRPDSAPLWLEVTCELMVAEGQPVSVLSTFTDITEKVTAERALRQSEQRYRLLAENASEVVVQTASDRQIVWVSPSVQTVLGYAPEDFVGRRLSEFLLPGEVERLQQEMAENIAQHRPGGERRMRMRTADGSIRWMSVLGRAITDDSGATIGGLDALRDIHDQVLAQTRLQQLLDSMAEGVVVIDAQGRITECNPAALSILGVHESDLVGQVVAETPWPTIDEYGNPLPGTVHPAVVALRTGQRVHDQLIGFVRGDGATTWLLVSADPVVDPETGERSRVVTTFIDISVRVAAQQELQEAQSRFRWLAENATDFVIYSDLQGILRWVSPSVQRVLGWAPKEVVGRPIAEFVHEQDQRLISAVDEVANSATVRIRSADGGWRWYRSSSKPLEDDDGQIVGRVTGLQDVQSEIEAREELREAHERLQLVLEASRLGLWDWNMQTGAVVVNERWAQIVGYELEELEPVSIETWESLSHPDDLEVSRAAIVAHGAGATPFYDVDVRMRHSDGHWVWVRDRGRVVEWDAAGTPVRMTGTHEDITALHNASEALVSSEERFRVAMASAPVGMAVLDLDRRIQQVNPALCALVGRSEQWLIGRSMAELIVTEDDPLDVSARRRLVDGNESSITVDHRLQRRDHAHIWVQQSISLVRGAHGAVTGFVSQFTDITEARQARRRLRDLASRDPLTDLYNRRELTVRLHRWQESRDVEKLALLFIDLDGLKAINDTHGHLVGDEVIQQQAARVISVVRSDDIVGRYGGDEFIVVAPGLADPQKAKELAHRIQQVTRQPIHVGDLLVDVTCSIGVSITDVAVDFDRILARADSAVYQAKRAGRDRVVLFESAPGD